MAHAGPYAQIGAKLVERGYAALPIIPGSKRPGVPLGSGDWRGMDDWAARAAARLPIDVEIDLWSASDGGVCVALGKGSRDTVAADIDTDEPGSRSAAEPVRGATAAIVDQTLCWHIARTAFRLGPLGRRSLDDALKAQAVVAYRPRASEVVVRRGRRVVRHIPLVVRTLIIGVRDADHLREVQRLHGVAEIVCHPEVEASTEGNVAGMVMRPARLDPIALQRFLVALAAGEVVQPVGIGVGQSVVVMVGPFASFPATVEQILPNDRVKVSVGIFGRPSPVELGIAEVQAA